MRVLGIVVLASGLAFGVAGSAVGKSGDFDKAQDWRLEGVNQSAPLSGQSEKSYEASLPDAQELEKLLAREAAGDPEDLFRLGLAYENPDLWEPDYDKAFSYFKRSEALGFPWAKAQLGYYYETGLAGPKDYKKAVSYYQQGADFGDNWSGLRLGYLYLEGQGIRQTDTQAFFWIQWASRGGLLEATSALGWLYENGRGTEVNLEKAAELYRKSAEAGYPNGWVNLGLMYEHGLLGKRNEERAVEFYRKASDMDYPRGIHHLGTMYHWGLGVEQDQAKSISLFRRSLDLGYDYSHVSLGLAFEQGKGIDQDYAQAAFHYQQAIETTGSPRALGYLGWLHAQGFGVEQDYRKAHELYEEAVGAGDEFATTELGLLLLDGTPVTDQDVNRGRRLLLQMAEKDDLSAILSLAKMYEHGIGVAQDPVEALSWYGRAKDLGSTTALIALGTFYEEGSGAEQDLDRASELYNQALEEGDQTALLDLGVLFSTKAWKGHDFSKALDYLNKAEEAEIDGAAAVLGISYFEGEWLAEDLELARSYLQRATENGNSVAAAYLGYMEEEGLGGLKEIFEAIRHYEIAAEGDNLYAALRLADLFTKGGPVTQSRKKALRWQIRAGELGDAGAAFQAAEVLYKDPRHEDREKASRLYRVAADGGNVEASVKWARMQVLGEVREADFFAGIDELRHVSQTKALSALAPLSQLVKDGEKGRDQYRRAQEKELFLGLAYANGIIFPQRLENAEEHLRQSLSVSDYPFVPGQFALANFLLETKPDNETVNAEILQLLTFAANRGHSNAQYALGQIYLNGSFEGRQLTEQNQSKAMMWFRLAAKSHANSHFLLAWGTSEGWDQTVDPSEGLRMLEDLAVAGDEFAAFQLGKHYSETPDDPGYQPDLAARWYEKAARFGDALAMLNLAILHDQGAVAGHSQATAFKYYLASAEAGNAEAARLVGWRYRKGRGVEENMDLAEEWFLKAVEMGAQRADLALAYLYIGEDEFDREKKEQAIQTLKMYADRGHAQALVALGYAYVEGSGVEKNPAKGLDIFEEAKRIEPARARRAIGEFHFLGYGGAVDYDLAFKNFSEAAVLGNARASANLGWMHQNGLGTEQDYREADRLYRVAIEHGIHDATVSLGVLYLEGLGVPKDEARAETLFREAAERGLEGSNANLGWMMLHGYGVPKDVEGGLAMIEQAALEDDHYGAYYLAVLLESGEVVQRDRDRAIELYKFAAEDGDFNALAALERLQK
ncbi:hypothetical protein ABLO27_16810 [Roseibium sp. SCPC15]|uniref:tetratricopeptide repeat protein n=1 Tax=Roseibium sp. SCP15 TaxID=3141376 RepID=UPI00333A1E88